MSGYMLTCSSAQRKYYRFGYIMLYVISSLNSTQLKASSWVLGSASWEMWSVRLQPLNVTFFFYTVGTVSVGFNVLSFSSPKRLMADTDGHNTA